MARPHTRRRVGNNGMRVSRRSIGSRRPQAASRSTQSNVPASVLETCDEFPRHHTTTMGRREPEDEPNLGRYSRPPTVPEDIRGDVHQNARRRPFTGRERRP
jgi:hypothetical protein